MNFYRVCSTIFLSFALVLCDFPKNIDKSANLILNGNQTLSTAEECARLCNIDEEPKICYYHFTVEYFATLSRACNLCRSNTTTRLTADCQCITADGYETSGIMTANRMHPGPSIMVCLNDFVVIDVLNRVPGNEMTIHWHGIYQKGYQYYDGVPYITQCPISEGATFRYQWRANNPGTHFWHSHTGLQKGDGLEGALIIREPKINEPNSDLWESDRLDHFIIITDLLHDSTEDHFPGTVLRRKGQAPDNFLINGLGQWTDPATGITTTSPLANFTVQAGHHYRFRLINSCSFTCAVQLTIENHNLTIIATDGEPVKPVTVTSVTSSSAERYDFIIHTNQSPGHYWIQLRGLGGCASLKLQQLAFLSYDAPPKLPELTKPSYDLGVNAGIILNALNVRCDNSTNAPNFVCVSQLENAVDVPPAILGTPDIQIYMPFGFYTYQLQDIFKAGTYKKFLVAPQEVAAVVGNISNVFPVSPFISQSENTPIDQICKIGKVPKKCAYSRPCACSHVHDIPLNSTVEIILVDEVHIPGLSHPFHLHGHSFHVLGEGRGIDYNITTINVETVKKLDNDGMIKRNMYSPPSKDTFAVPNNGFTIIRFIANNPGYWLFHCHFVYHIAIGMSLTFHVGEQSDLPPIPDGFPKCGSFTPPISNN